GISDDHSGLMVLEGGAPGMPVLEYLGTAAPDRLPSPHQVVFELSITPNRGDCLSHVGVAREIAAHLGRPLTVPEPETPVANDAVVSVTIEAPDKCARYIAAVVGGVRVGPSPAWLRDAVDAAGARSINNVVDVTNFVSFELGHPQHAFDFAALKGAEIVVRDARPGEQIEAINHESYELEGGDLVIADTASPVAIAGVMGGALSEVSDETTRIVFECARFDPS